MVAKQLQGYSGLLLGKAHIHYMFDQILILSKQLIYPLTLLKQTIHLLKVLLTAVLHYDSVYFAIYCSKMTHAVT